MNLSKEQQKTLRGIAKTAHLRGFKNKDIDYRIVDRAQNYRGDVYKDVQYRYEGEFKTLWGYLDEVKSLESLELVKAYINKELASWEAQ